MRPLAAQARHARTASSPLASAALSSSSSAAVGLQLRPAAGGSRAGPIVPGQTTAPVHRRLPSAQIAIGAGVVLSLACLRPIASGVAPLDVGRFDAFHLIWVPGPGPR